MVLEKNLEVAGRLYRHCMTAVDVGSQQPEAYNFGGAADFCGRLGSSSLVRSSRVPNRRCRLVWRRKRSDTFEWQVRPLIRRAVNLTVSWRVNVLWVPRGDAVATVRARAALDFVRLA